MSAKRIERLRGEGVVELAAGSGHVAAVSDAGDVWTWGRGLQGQLGHSDLENQVEPKLVATLQEKVIVAVAVGHSHTICLSDEDLPYTWGSLQGCASSLLSPPSHCTSSRRGLRDLLRCVRCRGRLGLGVLERDDPNPRLRKYFTAPTLLPFFRGKQVLQVNTTACTQRAHPQRIVHVHTRAGCVLSEPLSRVGARRQSSVHVGGRGRWTPGPWGRVGQVGLPLQYWLREANRGAPTAGWYRLPWTPSEGVT